MKVVESYLCMRNALKKPKDERAGGVAEILKLFPDTFPPFGFHLVRLYIPKCYFDHLVFLSGNYISLLFLQTPISLPTKILVSSTKDLQYHTPIYFSRSFTILYST